MVQEPECLRDRPHLLRPVGRCRDHSEDHSNGATKGSTSTAYPTPHISDTAVAQNWSGNQEWCTVVSGTYYSDGNSYPVYDKTCETAGF